jgi:uncharacterized protein (UPF0305 family)
MEIIKENIKVTIENQEEINKLFEDCEILSGSVYVRENARFTSPQLKQSGYVDVSENATFTANQLTNVSGSVYVRENARFTSPQLTNVSGYVDVSENATFTANQLTNVSGSVYVWENATFIAPQLKQSGYVDVMENATFTSPQLTDVSGSVYVSENATFTANQLTNVSGSVYVWENARFIAPQLKIIKNNIFIKNNIVAEKQLWKKFSKNKWILNEGSSDWLIEQKGDFEYYLNDVQFTTREWYLKIKNDKLTASQVFTIDNIEHRRIAYEFMDKTKMKKLKGEILDEKIDKYGNSLRIISFNIQNMELKFLNCFCPSTGREYFIGTEKKLSFEAKNASFGLDNNVEWVEEW